MTPPADTPTPRRDPRGGSRLLRRLSRYGILTVTVLAPLLIGGGPVWVQIFLAAGAWVAAVLWLLSRRRDISAVPFAGVAALAVAFTLFQLLPLPAPLVGLFSSHALELRSEAAGSAPWFLPLTLDVPATILAALRGLACLAILVVTASATHSRGASAVFASALALTGGAVAVLSFFQRLLGTDRIFGVYEASELPGSGVFGSFVCGNHAASLFTISMLMAIGCARERMSGRLRVAVGLSGMLSALALVSTGSRGGLVAAALGILLIATLWLVRRLGHQRGLAVAGALTLLAAPAAFLAALGMRGPLQATSLTRALSEPKVRTWRDMLSLVADYPWTGVGRGAFEGPAAAYRQGGDWYRIAFPENIFIQTLSEWGIPVTLALVALFLLTVVEIAKHLSRWEPVFQSAAGVVLAMLVHELTDFGLELPGIAFPTALALGLVAGRLQAARPLGLNPGVNQERRTIWRWRLARGTLAVWAVVGLASLWAAGRTTDADGARTEALVRQNDPRAGAALAQAITRHPADYYFEVLAAQHGQATSSPQVLRHLSRAQRLFPRSPGPHVLTARYLVAIGRPSQAALEYRLAIERGSDTALPDLRDSIGFRHMPGAVPQQPDRLIALARYFMSQKRVADADAASARAVDLAAGSETVRRQRIAVALESSDKAYLRKVGLEAGSGRDVPTLELAAEALAAAGDVDLSRKILHRLGQQHPADGALAVRGARMLNRHGDLKGARELLVAEAVASFALPDRVHAEELLADILFKEGHTDAAEAARVRARMLTRLIQDPHAL